MDPGDDRSYSHSSPLSSLIKLISHSQVSFLSQKLATLLNLPPTFELLTANVKLLKITVPADIYSSGIICEVNGVNVHLRCVSPDEPSSEQHAKRKSPTSVGIGSQGSGEVKPLPTPSNLAESFLEAEPKEEKDELQAALSSQSQVLPRGSSFTEEEEEELGLGNETLSLPSFVAAFLKGVADRLRLKIKDVSVRLDMELKQDAPSKRQPEDRPDLVSGIMSVGEIDVYEVSRLSPDTDCPLPFREGKRLISLVDIQVGLLADPVVFANYSRFMAPASPTTTMQSKESQTSSRAPSPPLLDSPDSDSALAMTRSTIFEPPAGLRMSRAETLESGLEESAVFSHDGRFSDADSDADNRSHSSSGDSQVFGNEDPFAENPGYLDSVIDAQFDEFDIESPEMSDFDHGRADERSGQSPPRSPHLYTRKESVEPSNFYPGQSSLSTRRSNDNDEIYDSQHESHFGSAAANMTELPKHPSNPDSIAPSQSQAHPVQTSSPPSETGSFGSESGTPNEDLVESKYFSHDEAQSLYMSAMSHGAEHSFVPNMPGAWDSSERDQQSTHSSILHSKTDTGENLQSSEYGHDEKMASTPKLTGPSDSYFGTKECPEDQSRSQFHPQHGTSAISPPSLHKITDTRKPILNINKILVWLPSGANDESVDDTVPLVSFEGNDASSNDLAYGVEESMFASKAYASTKFPRAPHDLPTSRETDHASQQDDVSSDVSSNKLEIETASAAINFDIATGWLLIKAGQLISRITDAPHKESPRRPSTGEQPSQQMPLSLSIKEISFNFVEHLLSYPYSSEAPTSAPKPSTPAEDVVLQITAVGINANLLPDTKRTQFTLNVSKFHFGFASEDLISFNGSLRMRESTRDLTSASQGDISLSLVRSAETTKVEITTLPLHVNFNVQRLEEVLGWMGGLSTILELGSSISSASTMKGGNKPPPKKRSRGVHFEKQSASQDAGPPKTSNPVKVNVRLGGAVLDVTSEMHSMSLSTTAVKVVSRFEGIGVQIDKARLEGPFSLGDPADAPAEMTLSNIRVEFLFVPKELDLDRLLTLITPSQDKYDDDDDIMVDTLLRQRRQGSVLRTTVGALETTVFSLDGLARFSSLATELGRLSNVAKYLPEDDRPGILTLTLIREINVDVHAGGEIGNLEAHLENAEAAWISMPSLIATQVGSVKITRNEYEELVGEALAPGRQGAVQSSSPVLMARFIPDEMDPTFKIKLHHLRVEYTIPSIMAFLGMSNDTQAGDFTSEMANSIANLAERSTRSVETTRHSPTQSTVSKASTKPMNLALLFRDCVIGLNPRKSPAKGLFVLSNAKFSGTMHNHESSEAILDIRKASLMIIDDVSHAGQTDNLNRRGAAVVQSHQTTAYIDEGYVPVTTISSATAVVKVVQLSTDGTTSLDVEFRDDLLILETCADSTQTLITILNGLQPPTPPNITAKYRTEVMPIQDMLASFTGDAFSAQERFSTELHSEAEDERFDPILEDPLSEEVEYVSDFYPEAQMGASDSNDLLDSFHSQYQISSSITELNFQDDHFAKKSAVGGTAHRWDSTHNTYDLSNDRKLQQSPLRLRVRDMHVIWNLFDGYDWQRTRDTISKAVQDVETKATERRARASRMSPEDEDDEESVIGDFLFNSIYIGIPANKDPRELHREINRDINDLSSETGSYATTTTVTGATGRQGRPASERGKKLRLSRSKQHKMTFELKGVCADLVVFPPGSQETQSSLDVRVGDLEIFDHVPTSTWKKFATYMHEAGERESGTSMVHLEILTVKPVPELAASEIVLKVSSSPQRSV